MANIKQIKLPANSSSSEEIYDIVDQGARDLLAGKADLNSPVFTGEPKVPSQDASSYDASSQSNIAANLKYVWDAVSSSSGGGGATVYNQLKIETTDWVSDTTYSAFPYKATIAIEEASVNTFGWITFNDADFAATCKSNPETGLGCVYIYANAAPTTEQYFNFWLIPTVNQKGATLSVALPPQ